MVVDVKSGMVFQRFNALLELFASVGVDSPFCVRL
jgi:hypothetical protein